MPMRRRVAGYYWPAAVLLLLALWTVPVVAAPDYPALTGRVVDQAQLLTERSRAELEQKLAEHERATGNQVVVATVTSLQGESIEDYGIGLGRHWGIGREGEDDGVLLIVAPDDREVRIEVGYGLEGTLTDALSGQIIQNDILPRFRSGDMAGGVVAGADAILAALGGTYETDAWSASGGEPAFASQKPPVPDWMIPLLFFGVWFLMVFVIRRFGRGRGRRSGFWMGVPGIGGFGTGGYSRGRGGFSGGGFSGGGGSFGGGGASGRW